MDENAVVNKRKSTAIIKRNYFGRVITYYIGGIPMVLEIYRQEVHIGVWIYLLSINILLPHIAYFLAKNSATPQKTEMRNMLAESFALGIGIPLLSFSVLPLMTPFLAILIYTTFYGGVRFYYKVLLSTVAGTLFSCLLFNFEVDFGAGLLTTYATVVILPLILLGLVLNIRADYGRSRDKIRKDKVRMEELATKLSKYLSPQVYSQIFLGKKEVRLESYRKKLTVFFSDIKGFTSLTDSMESEALSSLLNKYFNEMAAIAIRHGGTIDKYMGDAIMIFFGDPESLGEKEDAKACVLMALEMKTRLEQLRKDWEEQGISKKLRIRMGINTGYCTVGNFGSDDRLDYTIIGGQVNLASRLESVSDPDQILISHETHALVKDDVACQKKGEILVKGIAYPVQTYQVVDLRVNLKPFEKQLNETSEGFSLEVDFDKIAEDKAIASLKNAISRIELRKSQVLAIKGL